MSTPTQELAQLTTLLNTPNLAVLPIKVVIQGQIQIEAVGPNPLDVVKVLLQPGSTNDLLQFAPQSWWHASTSLYSAVQNGWLTVVVELAPVDNTTATQQSYQYIIQPANAQTGDLLVFNGTEWTVLSAGATGLVLTSNGPGATPSYQPGGGGGGEVPDQGTTGLEEGQVCRLVAPNTWTPAQADYNPYEGAAFGIYSGIAGVISLPGSIINKLPCTTDGGEPAFSSILFLAVSTADGGTGAGKVSATPPVPPVDGTVTLQTIGICVDASNYATEKTVRAIFQPGYPILLRG